MKNKSFLQYVLHNNLWIFIALNIVCLIFLVPALMNRDYSIITFSGGIIIVAWVGTYIDWKKTQ